jgi:hypothetical protein
LALIGLASVRDSATEREALHARIEGRLAQLAERGLGVDTALGRAAIAVTAGGPVDGAAILDEALANAPSGSAGWTIPVDPLLNVPAHEPMFSHVLARLRTRAA